MKAPILTSLSMLLQQVRHKIVVEKISPPHGRVHQVRIKPTAERIAKPLAHRRAKSALATVKQIVGQDLFQRSFKNVFSAGPFDLQTTSADPSHTRPDDDPERARALPRLVAIVILSTRISSNSGSRNFNSRYVMRVRKSDSGRSCSMRSR